MIIFNQLLKKSPFGIGVKLKQKDTNKYNLISSFEFKGLKNVNIILNKKYKKIDIKIE